MRIFDIIKYVKEYTGRIFEPINDLVICLVYPLIESWEEYLRWRLEIVFLTNVSSQTASIQGVLNKKFDSSFKRISIDDGAFDPLIYVPLNASEGSVIYLPLDSSEGTELMVPIDQFERVDEYDFIVNVPLSLSVNETKIKGTVKSQKLAGKTFKINYI
jgi:hypothetical protein